MVERGQAQREKWIPQCEFTFNALLFFSDKLLMVFVWWFPGWWFGCVDPPYSQSIKWSPTFNKGQDPVMKVWSWLWAKEGQCKCLKMREREKIGNGMVCWPEKRQLLPSQYKMHHPYVGRLNIKVYLEEWYSFADGLQKRNKIASKAKGSWYLKRMILKNMKIVLCKKGDSDFSLSRRRLSLLGSSCSDFHDFLWGNQKQFEMTRHEKKNI